MISNDERKKALQQLPESEVELYGALQTARKIRVLRNKFNITNEVIVDIVGDVILGLIPNTGIEVELMKALSLDSKTAGVVANEIRNITAQNTDSKRTVPDADSSIKEGIELRPEQKEEMGNASVPTPTNQSVPKPLTREELLSALSAKRTMASDIEAVRRGQTSDQTTNTSQNTERKGQ